MAGCSNAGMPGSAWHPPTCCARCRFMPAEKLNTLDLSPVWKVLPQSAHDVLEVWRAAAQRRAAAAAAPSPSHASSSTVAGVLGAAGEAASGAAVAGPHPAAGAAVAPAPVGQHAAQHGNSNAGVPAPLAASVAFWRQRQQLRRQQLLAALRRCLSSSGAGPCIPRRTAHAANPARRCAGVSKAVGKPRRSHKLTSNNGRGVRVTDPLEGSASLTAAAAAAAVAAAGSRNGTLLASGVLPVVATVAVCASTEASAQGSSCSMPADIEAQQQPAPQQLLTSQHAQAVHASGPALAAAHQHTTLAGGSRLRRKQHHARRLVVSAQQQQRAVRLARYQAVVKSWSLADMMAQVGCEASPPEGQRGTQC